MKKFGRFGVVLALGLSAALILSGCGGNGEGKAGDNSNESKSIRVFFGDTAGTDNKEVSDAVSKMSEEKIGVKVEMVFFGAGEYSQKIPKLMATNEQMDIGWDSGDNFVSRARDGAYYDISKDLDAYPALKDLFGEEFLGGVTIDGGIYGIPTLKEMAEVWAVYIDRETLDKYGIDETKMNTLSDIEPILAVLKSEGREGFGIDNKAGFVNIGILENYDTITGPFVVSNDDSQKASSKKVINYYETKEFENFVRTMRSWYQKGYISQDILENGRDSYAKAVTADPSKRGVSYVSYSPYNEVGQTKAAKKEMVPIKLTPTTISNNSTRGSVLCIYKKSENKQSSLKFLQLWNTDKEINTLIKFGIEGKHYNFIEEDGIKKVKKVDGATDMYLNQNWRSGNVLISQLEEGEPADKYEQYEKFNKSARKSCVLGFTPDLSSFEAELSACNAVVSTKAAALLTGAVDPDDPEYGLEAVKNEMEKSGSSKIVTEIQKQYLTWIKEK